MRYRCCKYAAYQLGQSALRTDAWPNQRFDRRGRPRDSVWIAARCCAGSMPFKEDLNCRIFDRSAICGYLLTPEAEKMIDAAREVESHAVRHAAPDRWPRTASLEGELRVTTTDTLYGGHYSRPHLASFQQTPPAHRWSTDAGDQQRARFAIGATPTWRSGRCPATGCMDW